VHCLNGAGWLYAYVRIYASTHIAPHHCCTAPLLHRTIVAPHHCCTAPLLHRTIVAPHHYCTAPLLHRTIIAPHHYCTAPSCTILVHCLNGVYVAPHHCCTAPSCTILVHCLNEVYVAPHYCCTAPLLHCTIVAFHNVKSHLTMRNRGFFLIFDTLFLDPHPPGPGGPTERKFVYFCNF